MQPKRLICYDCGVTDKQDPSVRLSQADIELCLACRQRRWPPKCSSIKPPSGSLERGSPLCCEEQQSGDSVGSLGASLLADSDADEDSTEGSTSTKPKVVDSPVTENLSADSQPKKVPRKLKKKNESKKSSPVETLRCCMCMQWHPVPVDEDLDAVWMCLHCRQLPSQVGTILVEMRNMRDSLASLQKTNEALVKQIASRTTQCDELSEENSALKARLTRLEIRPPNPPPTIPRTTDLLIGSSHVTRLERKCETIQVRGLSGGKIKDVTKTLKKHPENDTCHVHVVIGSNDCDSEATTESILEDCGELMTEAVRVARDKVSVASVLPRLTGQAYLTRADDVNNQLKDLCTDRHCCFVDNDVNFKLMNGKPDDTIFMPDKVHLTSRGSERLLGNLGLKEKVRVKPSYAQMAARTPPGREPQPRPPPKNGHDRRNGHTRHAGMSIACWYCGESGHITDSCRHGRRITCHRCGKRGHKQKLCRVKL